MRTFPLVLREPFRLRPTSPFLSSDHCAAGPLGATAAALDNLLRNR